MEQPDPWLQQATGTAAMPQPQPLEPAALDGAGEEVPPPPPPPQVRGSTLQACMRVACCSAATTNV